MLGGWDEYANNDDKNKKSNKNIDTNVRICHDRAYYVGFRWSLTIKKI